MLGAAVGEAILGKQTGHKAAIWGAVCGTIPDLDVVIGMFMEDLDKNIFHRSISHSILFFLALAPLTGWLLNRLHPGNQTSIFQWTQLAFWSYLTHALLDSFTTWGTQLFWPWDYKVAFKSIFVIDPLYTVPLIVFLILALKQKKNNHKRTALNWSGLIISSTYLIFTLINKQIIYNEFYEQVKTQNISVLRIETKPSPLNNILWAATVEDSLGFYIGYKSFLDKEENIQFEYFPKKHHLIEPFKNSSEIQKIVKLTEGWYTVESTKTGLKINDLRFGTNTAWEPGGDFVFSYNIEIDNSKILSINQGERNFKEDPKSIISNLIKRISGNQ